MMKKVLSVALSVIMVLGLIAVPGFAADLAATVEYTVSAVTYQRKYMAWQDEVQVPMYAPATEVPANGEWLVPSVDISATEDATATVIFAVYTDDVLTNAFYETKAVGTTPVTFTKEITVADSEKETYKVFALGADGKAIAPASSFPEADNALEYMVITYADGTSDKLFGADLTGDTIVSNTSAARKVANPTIKVVPVDNTTAVTIDMDANFWENGATVELKALDGTTVTYNVISDMIKAGFTPVLGTIYQYEGAELTKTIKTYEKQYASFEASQEVVNVTVPYGTATVSMDPIVIYENGVKKQSAAEEINMDGVAEKEYTIAVGSKEYKFVFKWDDSAPYVSEVKFGGDYATRSFVLRADGTSAIGYTQTNDFKTTTDGKFASEITTFTVNDAAIPLNNNFTVFALAREDNFYRTDMISYSHPKGVFAAETEAWTTFKVSEPATVYVKMSHANAAEADFVWKEGAAAGWTKATSSNMGVIYYKTFEAGATVNIPSQVVTEEELALVNAKLETAYPAGGEVQFKYALVEGLGAQLQYSTDGKAYDDESKKWNEHPTGKNDGDGKLTLAGTAHRGLYYRNTADHKLSIGKYGSDFFIAVAFNNTPGESGGAGGGGGETPDPDVPPTPAVPTLNWASALALSGEPNTLAGSAVNKDLYSKGLYGLAPQSGSIELDPTDTTVDITVKYGTEAITLNGGAKIDLYSDADHAVTTNVTVEDVEYTVNIAWDTYAYEAGLPMLYDLQYYVSGKTNLLGGNSWYYAVPSNLVLNAGMDFVLGTGDLKGTYTDEGKTPPATTTVDRPEGTWYTIDSQQGANLMTVNNGANINRLRLAPTSFESFVTSGHIADKYAFDGATVIVVHYLDAAKNTLVSPRYTFKSAVDGYVIAAYCAEQTLDSGWTRLEGAKILTGNSSTGDQGKALKNPPEGHTNPVTSFGLPYTEYEYVYVKAVEASDVVSINETAVTAQCPPAVMVVTEDMLDVDLGTTPEDPTPDPDEPTTASLASYIVSTTVAAVQKDVAAVTDEAGTFADTANYEIVVPAGSATATATITDTQGATATATVDFGTADAKSVTVTVGEADYTVNFVWDDTNPYIYNVNIKDNSLKYGMGRYNVQYGSLATELKIGGDKNNAVAGDAVSTLTFTGVPTPDLTEDTVVLGLASALVGQPHMSVSNFVLLEGAYPATNADNAFISFQVNGEGTIYVKSPANAGTWPEMEALVADTNSGWYRVTYEDDGTKNATIAGYAVYAIDVESGDTVLIPGCQMTDSYMAAYNANLASRGVAERYIKYDADGTVETTTSTTTQEAAMTAATITYTKAEGTWYKWKWDNTEDKAIAPVLLVQNPGTEKETRRASMATHNRLVVYGYFGEYTYVPETPVEPEEPTATTLASLSYTTALAVTEPKGSVAANSRDGASLHAGGFYQPTLVTEAATVTVAEDATTVNVTVPYGSEIVNLAGTDSQEGAVAFDAINLINNNGAATVTKTVGEVEYTINVAWAAYDAEADAANNHVYDVKYKIHDLANTNYYNIVPTKLVLTENRIAPQSVIGYKDNAGAAVTKAAGEWYVTADVAGAKSNLLVHNAGQQINRGRLSTIAFDGWVRAGLVTASGIPGAAMAEGATDAEVDAIAYNAFNGATTFVTHFLDHGDSSGSFTGYWNTASGVNAEMAEHLSFKVAQDSIVYVSTNSSALGEEWTEFEGAGTLILHNQINNYIYTDNGDGTFTQSSTKSYVTHDYSAGTKAFYRYAQAGDTVTVTVNAKNNGMGPVIIVRAIDEIPATPEPAALGDIEDGGMAVAAAVAADFDVTQDAASSDVTVEGNKGVEARGTEVIAFVLGVKSRDTEGNPTEMWTLADVQAAIAAGGSTGDLVAEGLVLAMGSATVDANGDYSIDLTLPASVTSGSYDVVVDNETKDGALGYVAIAEKVAAYNAIVNGEANPFAKVDLIIATADLYAGLGTAGQAAVEASVLAKYAVDALPAITESTGLENIATLGAIIDTRIAVEVLNEGADAAELALVWDYILPAADADSADIAAVAAAIYADTTALNATGKANVVAAISEQAYETLTVEGVQVPVKAQVQADFAEAAFVELINNTAYTNINSVATLVNKYIAAGVFEDITSVSTTTLSTIVRDYTIASYADFEAKVDTLVGGNDTPSTPGTEIVPSTPGTNTGTTSGSMSSTTGTSEPTPVPTKKQLSDFVDANDAAWAATALQMMLDREILSGYEDNTIRPNNNATRQEVAKMLVEAFSEVRAGAWTGFADVPAGSWYYSYVATAAEDGIIKGVSATEFGTDALITREDLSVLIYRFLANKGIAMNTNANRTFTDAASMSDYAVDAINALANAGVINGYTDGSFNPKGNATRAEIAQVIANVIVLYAL